jgi:hypothetical protein
MPRGPRGRSGRVWKISPPAGISYPGLPYSQLISQNTFLHSFILLLVLALNLQSSMNVLASQFLPAIMNYVRIFKQVENCLPICRVCAADRYVANPMKSEFQPGNVLMMLCCLYKPRLYLAFYHPNPTPPPNYEVLVLMYLFFL